jgi:hypothetical protein
MPAEKLRLPEDILNMKSSVFDNRITLFTGHFGSGKSEISLNFALEMKKIYSAVAFADLDIVNPFFRSTDGVLHMEDAGIKFVKTLYANTNVDVPALPPEMNALFENKKSKVVMDIGGDDLGAKVVSRYKQEITEAGSYSMFSVVNVRRPVTSTPELVIKMLDEIEVSSRVKITGLVNNTNLLAETRCDDMLYGHNVLLQVSRETGIPIAFAAGLQQAFTGIENIIMESMQYGVLLLNRLIRLPWEYHL